MTILPGPDCTTMAEVRAGVDALDRELVALLRRRFDYMDAAARIKPERGQVRDEARIYLPWLAIAPLIGVASWMFDGIFIGATLTREMRIAMFQSVAIYVVMLLILPAAFGNHGLWAALMVLNAVRGLTMARLYPRAEAVAA